MQEPNYNITDGNGDLVGQVGTNSNGDILVEHSSGEQAVLSDSGLAVDALQTEDTTNRLLPATPTVRDTDTCWAKAVCSRLALG